MQFDFEMYYFKIINRKVSAETVKILYIYYGYETITN